MSTAPSVSVLLPVRDAAATLDAAVESVLAQTGPSFELLAVDDGSQDGSLALLEAHASRDARVRVVQQAALGLIPALNNGLSQVRGALVARMDADDRMLPGRLAAQTAALEANPEWALVATHVRLVPPTGGMQRHVDWLNSHCTPADVAREIFVDSPLCHPSVMFRAQRIHALGGYRDPGWAEDHDLWLRLFVAGASMGVVPRPLHEWHDRPQRLTRTHPRYSADAMMRMKAHYLCSKYGKKLRIWGAGRDGKRLARAIEAEGAEITLFVDIDPAKIGGVRRGSVPVIGPQSLGPPQSGDPFLVAAVGVAGARDAIRGMLAARGFVETRDFICAA